MIRRIKVIPLLLSTVFILSCILIALPVSAANDIQRVYDNAGLLSDDEIDKLEQQAEKYSAKRDINYLIVTTDNPEELLGDVDYGNSETTTGAYSDTFYDKFVETYGNNEENCSILTIDMSNRYAYIEGYAGAFEGLNNARCTKASEKIAPSLSDQDYYSACSDYINIVHRYLGIKPGVDPDLIILKTWFQILFALGVAAITVGIMIANSGGRVTVNQGTYLDQKDSRILAKRDMYVRTTTTRIRKPQANSNGGGGGGGSRGGGSGGGSHF